VRTIYGGWRRAAAGRAMDEGERVRRERWLRGAVLSGDEAAWRAWYEEHCAALEAYVHWRCAGVRDLAEDALQETWLTAVRGVRRFRPEAGSFRQWLFGVAANIVRNQLRARRRRARRQGTIPSPASPRDRSTNVDGMGARAEAVASALAELPERYEQVLRAKYVEQQSVEEIAAGWGETPKAIESLLTRARQAFRDAYAAEETR
jgi:RNA polymerase sigma-70 factor, ECF subfamily